MTFVFGGFEASKIHEPEWSLYNHLNVDLQRIGQEVAHVTGSDRTVRIATGFTRIKGILIRVTEPHDVQANGNGSSNPRIDTLVWRVDWSAKTAEPVFRQGTPGSNPQPPTLDRTVNNRWEEPLANVRVNPGQGAFTSESITPIGPPIGVPWELLGPRAYTRRVKAVDGTILSGQTHRLQTWNVQREAGHGVFEQPNGTSSWQVPYQGLYKIVYSVDVRRTNTNQNGGVWLQLRLGPTGSTNISSNSQATSVHGSVYRSRRFTMGSYMGGIARQTLLLVTEIHLNAGAVGVCTVQNETTHTLNIGSSGAHTWLSIDYWGPSTGFAELPSDDGDVGGD